MFPLPGFAADLPATVLAAGDKKFNADHTTATVLLSIAAVVAVALAAGALARRLGQPRVIGEIIGGILLGPTLLGHVPGHLTEHLFPNAPDNNVRPFLGVVAQIGLVLFMFLVGVEADPGLVKGRERLAVAVSLSSIAAPFTLGVLAALSLHDRHGVVGGKPVATSALALFLGAAMSVTAFPVLARIIEERHLARTPLGSVVLASAAVDDVVAWALLAGVLSIVASTGISAVVTTVALTLLWALVMFVAVRPLLAVAARRLAPDGGLTPVLFTLMLGVLLLSAWATSRIGIHLIIGAFVAGVVLPGSATGGLRSEVVRRIEPVAVTLLLPVFFVVTGLGVDLGAIGRRGLVDLGLILGVAVVGKFGGASIAARVGGLPTRRALAVGVLMNTRGLTELVILSVGRDVGVLDPELYALLVVMAVVTTLMAGPLLSLVYPPRLVAADLADDERARDRTGPRVLAVVGDPAADPAPEAPAASVLALAAAVASGFADGDVTLSRFLPAGPGGGHEFGARSGVAQVGIALAELGALGREVTVPVRPAALLVSDAAEALRTQARRLRPDLVVLTPDGPPAGPLALATGVETAVVRGTPTPGGAVVLLLSGDVHDVPAAEVAARVAAAQGVAVHVLASGRRGAAHRRLAQVVERLQALGLQAEVLEGPGQETAAGAGGGWRVQGEGAGAPAAGVASVTVSAAEHALRLDVLERLERIGTDGTAVSAPGQAGAAGGALPQRP